MGQCQKTNKKKIKQNINKINRINHRNPLLLYNLSIQYPICSVLRRQHKNCASDFLYPVRQPANQTSDQVKPLWKDYLATFALQDLLDNSIDDGLRFQDSLERLAWQTVEQRCAGPEGLNDAVCITRISDFGSFIYARVEGKKGH